MSCGFCGAEIEEQDKKKIKKFWDRDGGVYIDICLNCMRSINGLCMSEENIKAL